MTVFSKAAGARGRSTLDALAAASWPPVIARRAATWMASFGNRLASKKAQNQATKNITSEAMNMIMP
ncbi:MAG: hypothetical protein U5O16_25585 [Rhodococcus sp. (in: high G+C Gram-positive bacteria)]|uniref:hypothetical protein n=1 Tax=Rhodococcus sp. TaxID=1831 RepID=UPI002AD870AD|nr:hypothetical protein [Rhodococcus sp. (in: high G+C Gram-positive bacteria)]